MAGIKNLRNFAIEVPETVERARQSLDNLDGGVRRANTTMAVLAAVAVVALALATIALLRVEAVRA